MNLEREKRREKWREKGLYIVVVKGPRKQLQQLQLQIHICLAKNMQISQNEIRSLLDDSIQSNPIRSDPIAEYSLSVSETKRN